VKAGDSNDVIVGVSFVAKEGVDQFDLGEFVGRINFALTAGSSVAGKKGEKAYTVLKPKVFKQDDQLGVTIYLAGSTKIAKDIPKGLELFDLLNVESVKAAVELNKRPSPDAKIDDPAVAIRVSASAQAHRPSLLAAGKKGMKKEKEMFEFLVKLLTATVEADFDDTDFVLPYFGKELKEILLSKGDAGNSDDDEDAKNKPLPKLNWGIPRALLMFLWKELLKDAKKKSRSRSDEPDLVTLGFEIYSKAVSTLESLHSITVANGKNLVECKCRNCDFFSVLPSGEDIEAQFAKKEKDDDDNNSY